MPDPFPATDIDAGKPGIPLALRVVAEFHLQAASRGARIFNCRLGNPFSFRLTESGCTFRQAACLFLSVQPCGFRPGGVPTPPSSAVSAPQQSCHSPPAWNRPVEKFVVACCTACCSWAFPPNNSP